MKKFIYYIIICLSVGMISCVDEDFVAKGSLGEGETLIRLNFGHENFEEVEVKSRATLSKNAESRVENLFVYIFNNEGIRVYSHYFDNTNKVTTLPEDLTECWTVTNYTNTNQTDTHGSIQMKVPVISNASIYIVANLNSDLMNISSDELSFIEKLEDLKKLDVTLNQEIISRGGGFIMSGSVEGVNIADNGTITQGSKSVSVDLARLDAKVTVDVILGESWDNELALEAFYPESWSVMRLPKGCKVITNNSNEISSNESDFFDSEGHYFEKDDGVSSYGFSFYMLENKCVYDGGTLREYHQRDERKKKEDGTYDLSNGMWKYADDNATYMVIKGRLKMQSRNVTEEQIFDMQYLEAEVAYYVHLGNFGSGNYNDFSADRNTHYTYTITIHGVNNIEVEVTDDKENQSGAIGDLYKSREEVYIHDAHYSQRVYRIDSRAVVPSTLTWYVKTPFGEGRPGYEFGTIDPKLDYKWAWFMVNPINVDGKYSELNQWYPGDDTDNLWNVMEMVEWLRSEKTKLENGEESAFVYYGKSKDGEDVYFIYVTVFVDEFYYEKHPITGNEDLQLWKQFVNKPHRVMHILCDSKFSKDGDSSLTNSVLTLRQRSIQTPYSTTNAGLTTAWGCETKDEFIDSQLFFFDTEKEKVNYEGNELHTWDRYNLGELGTSVENNGLYNSLKIWGITAADEDSQNGDRWDKFFDYERVNDDSIQIRGAYVKQYFLKKDYLNHRYSTLMRNRDNNGDGIIQKNELRWYLATMNQLNEIYIGQLGIDSEAHLYPASKKKIATKDDLYENGAYNYNSSSGTRKWRNHIICSTWIDYNGDGNAHPQVLWSEEGLSISYYRRTDWSEELRAPLSTRCVRNLGISEDISIQLLDVKDTNSKLLPQKLIEPEYNKDDDTYLFDLSNVNSKSLRFYTTHELELGDEYSEMSKPYYKFKTGKVFQRKSLGTTLNNNVDNYRSLKTDLEIGNSTGCPYGYRVPNVREGAIIALYCDSDWWEKIPKTDDSNDSNDSNVFRYIMVATTYSKGDFSEKILENAKYASWQFGYRAATLGKGAVRTIVPVRDVK